MMVAKKLSEKDVDEIKQQLQQGRSTKKLAEQYNVHQSTIQRRCKDALKAKTHSLETKLKVIKKVKQGFSKAEAGLMYGVSPHTVISWTKDIKCYKYAGNHLIRQNGIKLLNRLLTDGYLVSDFLVANARRLQKHFPMIRNARFKGKTFFYLSGREEDAIEGYFKEKPDRIISYVAVQELSRLLGVEFHKSHALRLTKKYKGQHNQYWKSRKLVQKALDEWM